MYSLLTNVSMSVYRTQILLTRGDVIVMKNFILLRNEALSPVYDAAAFTRQAWILGNMMPRVGACESLFEGMAVATTDVEGYHIGLMLRGEAEMIVDHCRFIPQLNSLLNTMCRHPLLKRATPPFKPP